MQVHTVRGPISPEELGITLPHEHLLFDLSVWYTDPQEATKKAMAETPVSLEILGELRRDAFANKDNVRQLDVDLAIREVMYFKRAGGRTIVDLTSIGLGRDALALRAVSEETGLNIVAGCGFYIDASHPSYLKKQTVDEVATAISKEISSGIDDTGIRAGIIGEIGTGWPLSEGEEKVIRASARAHLETKAPINVHPYPFGKFALSIIEILEEEGVDLHKVVLSHIDESGFDMDYHKSLAKKGVYIGYDTFGSEVYFDSIGTLDPRDTERVAGVVDMIRSGFASQLLLSHDVCLKTHLKRYGGYGYDHLLMHVIPMFKRAGVKEEDIHAMVVENPKRLLTF